MSRRLAVLVLLAALVPACSEISALESGLPSGGKPEGEWHRVLADTLVRGDVVVPDGEAWLIGPRVRIEGNLRTVSGTIAMRPGSSLHLLGADPAEYVGGGMHYEDGFARDIGVWVGGHGARGVLDIQCTPKQGWNRTGQHPTWEPADEYWIAPTDAEDFTPRRWNPGDPVPQVDPRVPAAEVVNVTRDCLIEGPGHIHIHSRRPSRIEYVRLEGLGVAIQDGRRDPAETGRYALHLHMQGEGSRGTVIRGVAAVNSRGRVFVPHSSHGVTMLDNVSLNSWAHGFWWDPGDHTNDVLVDGLAVIGMNCPICSGGGWPDLIELAEGTNMTIRNSVAAGGSSRAANGFVWLGSGSSNRAPAVWAFEQGNVAHNNRGAGVRFWTNTRQPHVTSGFVTYRNGLAGIFNGAYRNSNRYSDVVSFEDGSEGRGRAAGIHHHTNSHMQDNDDGPARYERVHIISPGGPALLAQGRALPATTYLEVIDSVLESAPGFPTVHLRRGGHPWLAHFIRSGVTPDDFAFDLEGAEGTHILIDHEDGRRWEIHIQGGRKIVTERRAPAQSRE
jgi:hypothetical protein